jgi:hypothetical protein
MVSSQFNNGFYVDVGVYLLFRGYKLLPQSLHADSFGAVLDPTPCKGCALESQYLYLRQKQRVLQ